MAFRYFSSFVFHIEREEDLARVDAVHAVLVDVVGLDRAVRVDEVVVVRLHVVEILRLSGPVIDLEHALEDQALGVVPRRLRAVEGERARVAGHDRVGHLNVGRPGRSTRGRPALRSVRAGRGEDDEGEDLHSGHETFPFLDVHHFE